jgi:hypothetical protein
VTREAAQAAGLKWRETNYLLLRRGPYVIAAGLDESTESAPRVLKGRFVDLFDADLRVLRDPSLEPGSRRFLLDLDAAGKGNAKLLLSACKALDSKRGKDLTLAVEGVGKTSAVVLVHAPSPPQEVTLDENVLNSFEYAAAERLLWVRFENDVRPRELKIRF